MSAKGFLSKWLARSFDAWARDYDVVARRKIELRGYSYSVLASSVLRAIEPRHGARLLEVGTGPGTLGIQIAAQAPVEIVGVDISYEMLRRAREQQVYHTLIRAGAERLPIESESLDGLFCSFVLHSVFDKSAAFREIHRVLRAGATAVIIDLFPIGRPRLLGRLLGVLNSIRHEHGAPSAYMAVEDHLRLALDAGLAISCVRRVGIKKKYSHFLLALKKEGGCDEPKDPEPSPLYLGA